MTDLASLPPVQPADALARYARASRADSTWEKYGRDWRAFESWCAREGRVALPASPETIAEYVVDLVTSRTPPRSIRYVRRHVAAIGLAHATAGFDPPPTRHQMLREVLKGLARTHGRPAAKRKALSGEDLARLIERTSGGTLAGKRDRALLAIGYFAARRRSEIVGLDREHIEEVAEGLNILIVRSKTDPEGEGMVVGVKRRRGITDPVSLYRSWLAASGITEGPLFRPIDRHGNMAGTRLTDHAVALIVKRACERAGIDPAVFSGHSLRRGFATSAARGGADGLLIRKQTRHKSDAMVAEYVEEGQRFGRHAQDFIDTGD